MQGGRDREGRRGGKAAGDAFWPTRFQEPFIPHPIMSRNNNFIKVCSLKTVGPEMRVELFDWYHRELSAKEKSKGTVCECVSDCR